MNGRSAVAAATVLGMLAVTGHAVRAADPVAVLTEVHKGHGDVRVRLAGENDWKAPQPLMSLNAGDQLRATADAWAVVVLRGGTTATVTQANSPYAVAAAAAVATGDSMREVVASTAYFLLGHQKAPTYVGLRARGAPAARRELPTIVSPRETRVAPGPIVFAWTGPASARYTVRVFGSDGLVWSASDLASHRLPYPPDAPRLRAGVLYVWELGAQDYATERAQFEIVPDAEMAKIEADLRLLRGDAPASPSATAALLRAARLSQDGLYQAGLDELTAAIARDADEPTLHEMLGHLYDRIGLRQRAADAFAAAHAIAGDAR